MIDEQSTFNVAESANESPAALDVLGLENDAPATEPTAAEVVDETDAAEVEPVAAEAPDPRTVPFQPGGRTSFYGLDQFYGYARKEEKQYGSAQERAQRLELLGNLALRKRPEVDGDAAALSLGMIHGSDLTDEQKGTLGRLYIETVAPGFEEFPLNYADAEGFLPGPEELEKIQTKEQAYQLAWDYFESGFNKAYDDELAAQREREKEDDFYTRLRSLNISEEELQRYEDGMREAQKEEGAGWTPEDVRRAMRAKEATTFNKVAIFDKETAARALDLLGDSPFAKKLYTGWYARASYEYARQRYGVSEDERWLWGLMPNYGAAFNNFSDRLARVFYSAAQEVQKFSIDYEPTQQRFTYGGAYAGGQGGGGLRVRYDDADTPVARFAAELEQIREGAEEAAREGSASWIDRNVSGGLMATAGDSVAYMSKYAAVFQVISGIKRREKEALTKGLSGKAASDYGLLHGTADVIPEFTANAVGGGLMGQLYKRSLSVPAGAVSRWVARSGVRRTAAHGLAEFTGETVLEPLEGHWLHWGADAAQGLPNQYQAHYDAGGEIASYFTTAQGVHVGLYTGILSLLGGKGHANDAARYRAGQKAFEAQGVDAETFHSIVNEKDADKRAKLTAAAFAEASKKAAARPLRDRVADWLADLPGDVQLNRFMDHLRKSGGLEGFAPVTGKDGKKTGMFYLPVRTLDESGVANPEKPDVSRSGRRGVDLLPEGVRFEDGTGRPMADAGGAADYLARIVSRSAGAQVREALDMEAIALMVQQGHIDRVEPSEIDGQWRVYYSEQELEAQKEAEAAKNPKAAKAGKGANKESAGQGGEEAGGKSAAKPREYRLMSREELEAHLLAQYDLNFGRTVAAHQLMMAVESGAAALQDMPGWALEEMEGLETEESLKAAVEQADAAIKALEAIRGVQMGTEERANQTRRSLAEALQKEAGYSRDKAGEALSGMSSVLTVGEIETTRQGAAARAEVAREKGETGKKTAFASAAYVVRRRDAAGNVTRVLRYARDEVDVKELYEEVMEDAAMLWCETNNINERAFHAQLEELQRLVNEAYREQGRQGPQFIAPLKDGATDAEVRRRVVEALSDIGNGTLMSDYANGAKSVAGLPAWVGRLLRFLGSFLRAHMSMVLLGNAIREVEKSHGAWWKDARLGEVIRSMHGGVEALYRAEGADVVSSTLRRWEMEAEGRAVKDAAIGRGESILEEPPTGGGSAEAHFSLAGDKPRFVAEDDNVGLGAHLGEEVEPVEIHFDRVQRKGKDWIADTIEFYLAELAGKSIPIGETGYTLHVKESRSRAKLGAKGVNTQQRHEAFRKLDEVFKKAYRIGSFAAENKEGQSKARENRIAHSATFERFGYPARVNGAPCVIWFTGQTKKEGDKDVLFAEFGVASTQEEGGNSPLAVSSTDGGKLPPPRITLGEALEDVNGKIKGMPRIVRSGGGVGTEAHFSIIGEHAATWDKHRGRAFTGRADGKARAELDASQAELLEDGVRAARREAVPLGKFVDFPELFAAYPQLAALPVRFSDSLERDVAGSLSMFPDSGEQVILLNAALKPEAVLPMLLHEAQHAIQGVEGFAPGGTLLDAYGVYARGLNDRISSFNAQLPPGAALPSLSADVKDAPGGLTAILEALANVGGPEAVAMRDEVLSVGSRLADIYRDFAGEREARAVAGRVGMTAEERETHPFEGGGNAEVQFSQRGESLEEVTAAWRVSLARYERGEFASREMKQIDLRVGPTPAVLQMIGAKDVDLVMTPAVLDKATVGKHAISLSELAKLPMALHEPVCVAQSDTRDSVELITVLKEGEHNILVAVNLDTRSHRSRAIKVNRITSLYGKENIKALLGHPMLYWDKAKARVWTGERRLQLPGRPYPNAGYKGTILKPADLVKWKEKNGWNEAAFSARDAGAELGTLSLIDYAAGRLAMGRDAAFENYTERVRKGLKRAADRLSFGEFSQEGGLAAMSQALAVLDEVERALPGNYGYGLEAYKTWARFFILLHSTGEIDDAAASLPMSGWPEVMRASIGRHVEDYLAAHPEATAAEFLKEYGQKRTLKLIGKFLDRALKQYEYYLKDIELGRMRRVASRVAPRHASNGKPLKGKMSADGYRKLGDLLALTGMTQGRWEAVQDDWVRSQEEAGVENPDWSKIDPNAPLEVDSYDGEGNPVTLHVTALEFNVYACWERMTLEEARGCAAAVGEFIGTERHAWQNAEDRRKAALAEFAGKIHDAVGEVDRNRWAKTRNEAQLKKFMGNKFLDSFMNAPQFFDLLASVPGVKDLADAMLAQLELGLVKVENSQKERRKFLHETVAGIIGSGANYDVAEFLYTMKQEHEVKFTGEDGVEHTLTIREREPDWTMKPRRDYRDGLLKLLKRKARTRGHDAVAGLVRKLKVSEALRRELELLYPPASARDVKLESMLTEQELVRYADEEGYVRERAEKARSESAWAREGYSPEPVEVTMSRDAAAYHVLLYEQDDYQEMLERKGFTPDAIDALRAYAGPDMMRLAYAMREYVGRSSDAMRRVVESRYGCPFAPVKNYFRAYFDVDVQEQERAIAEGAGYGDAQGNARFGSIYARHRHEADTDRLMGATTAFEASMREQDVFLHLSEAPRTIRAVLNFRDRKAGVDTRKELHELLGAGGMERLRKWTDQAEKTGVEYIRGHLELNKALAAFSSASAVVALSGRMGTIMKQYTAILNGMHCCDAVDAGAYFASMGRVMRGKGMMSVEAMMRQEEISSRSQSEFLELSAALSAPMNAQIDKYGRLSRDGMRLMDRADVYCNAVSSAIVYDAVYRDLQEKQPEATHEALHAAAMAQVRHALAQKSQPNNHLSRSLIAQNKAWMLTGPLWLAGESINTAGNVVKLFRQGKPGRAMQVWLMHGAMLSLLQAALDWMTDDEEKRRKRSMMGYVAQIILGPLQGIPIVSTTFGAGLAWGVNWGLDALGSEKQMMYGNNSMVPYSDLSEIIGKISRGVKVFTSSKFGWQDKVMAADEVIRCACIALIASTPMNAKSRAAAAGMAASVGAATNLLDFLLKTERAAEERLFE